MIFDSHAHYDDKQYDKDRDEVLAHLKDAGVDKVVNISNGWGNLLQTLELTERIPFLYGTVGIHPCEIKDLTEERMEQMREFCHRDKIVAVGEIGLDYHWMADPKEGMVHPAAEACPGRKSAGGHSQQRRFTGYL